MHNREIKIAFLGDIALNNRYASINENPFSKITSSYNDANYVVGNLEALLEGEEGFNTEKKPYLFTKKSAYSWLKKLNLDLVSLAQNHVYDTFDSGFINTTKYLKKINLPYLGAKIDSSNTSVSHKTLIGDKKIAFLNYCHPNTNFKKPSKTGIELNIYNVAEILSQIQQHKKESDHVILLLHWGGDSDYGVFPKMDQLEDARRFIDAGVSAIIGHHAHCIQPISYYKGKPIAFCLGNFCFDDIICGDKTHKIRQSAKKGIIVKLTIAESKIEASYTGLMNQALHIVPSKKAYIKLKLVNIFFKIYKRSSTYRRWHTYYLKRIEPLLFYIETTKYNIVTFFISRLYVKLKQKFNLI